MKFTTLAFALVCLMGARRPVQAADGEDGDAGGSPKVFNMFSSLLGSASSSANDLGIRFNKVGEVREGVTAQHLGPDDYPISLETAAWMRKSQCPSVVAQDDCGSCKYDFDELIQAVGGYPSHPESDENAPYWKEFRHVTEIQKARRADIDPAAVMAIPDIWKNFDIEQVAKAVHNEYPGENQANLIADFMRQGAMMDTDIIPIASEVEFLRKIVLLASLNTWSVSNVGPHNFGVKYSAGRARPEEVAFMIKQRVIGVADGVPQDIVDSINEMDFSTPEEYTAYPEGSPCHPSWPAMHSAASSASLWLPVVMNLTDEQLCQAQMVDYGVSYGRTVAGVHYPTDNIAGLNLGAELVTRMLPAHLEETYQADRSKVERKLEKYRFDWGTFEVSECYLKNKLPATTS